MGRCRLSEMRHEISETASPQTTVTGTANSFSPARHIAATAATKKAEPPTRLIVRTAVVVLAVDSSRYYLVFVSAMSHGLALTDPWLFPRIWFPSINNTVGLPLLNVSWLPASVPRSLN